MESFTGSLRKLNKDALLIYTMNIKNVHLVTDRRCDAKKLEEILRGLPIEVDFNGRLSARMGLGRIIYIQPEDDGKVKSVKIDGVSIERQDNLFFEYAGQKYEIRYN